MELSRLAPPKGARRKKVRLGRGESSGVGKTSGRGGKGQTARSGGTINPGFEGGQMPFYRRLPKWGFRSQSKVLGLNRFQAVRLDILEKFDAGATVDAEALWGRGIGRTNSVQGGFKVLASGELTKKLHLKVQAISAAARAKVESLGGTIEIVPLP